MKEQIPDFQTLMYPILDYLRDTHPHSFQDVYEYLAKKFQLSEDHLAIRVPSGQQPLFRNRATWSVSYLKNAGLLNTLKKGTYQITEMGLKVLSENVTFINTAYLKKFEGFKLWQSTFDQEEEKGATSSKLSSEIQTPEELIGNSIKRSNEKLAIDLLETLKQKTPAQFEKFVLLLLEAMGYGGTEEKNFEVVGKSGDNGVDGIIYQDKLGLDRIYVQAKKWDQQNKVQSKEIRDFIGSLSLRGTNKGIFITTSQFTEDALATTRKNPQNIIILIDGKKLTELVIQFNVGVQVKERYELKTIDNDYFDEL